MNVGGLGAYYRCPARAALTPPTCSPLWDWIAPDWGSVIFDLRPGATLSHELGFEVEGRDVFSDSLIPDLPNSSLVLVGAQVVVVEIAIEDALHRIATVAAHTHRTIVSLEDVRGLGARGRKSGRPPRERMQGEPIRRGSKGDAESPLAESAGPVATRRQGPFSTGAPGITGRSATIGALGAPGAMPEYRREAAALVLDTDRPIAHVAEEIGVGAQLLGRWVQQERERRPSIAGR